MNRLQRINEYLLMIFVAVIMFLIGITVLHSAVKEPKFNYENFLEQQQEFSNCINDTELFTKAQDFHSSFLDLELEEITEEYHKLIETPNCQASYVTSTYDEVKEMALIVVSAAQEFFNSEDIKVIDAVYTTKEQYSALLQQPQEYLFFALNSDQSRIIALTIKPTREGYVVQNVWEYEQSDDVLYTQSVVQKLLIVFNEIKQ